jgi:ABC-2 type transport system ATP-binding protein
MSAIAVSELTKSFGTVQAVRDLSFTVEQGAVTGFLGPNGAGKTTTLRMILGLVRPSGGTALVHDRPYADLAAPFTQVGAVLEAAAFHPGRTARVHLHALCKAARLPLGRADEVLEEVELTGPADRRVGGFSLGMRQRLALASALLGSPRTLILDEPANGLDPEGIHWMRAFIRSYAASGRTVLVSSHVLAEIEQVVDHVVIIRSGRLLWKGALGELTAGRTLEDAYLQLARGAEV